MKMIIMMVVFLAELAWLVVAEGSWKEGTCVWSDCYTYRSSVSCKIDGKFVGRQVTTDPRHTCRGGLGTACSKERNLCFWAWEVSSGSSFDETQSCH
jgi:hypothetical protein